jgi:hypothetical protein
VSLDADQYRAHTRRTDPWTSHEAADSIASEKIRASQQAILECFRHFGPMWHQLLVANYRAAQEAMDWPEQSESGLRTRTSELVARGLVRNTGQIVRLKSKRKSIVWELVLGPEATGVREPRIETPPQLTAAEALQLETE